MAFTFLFVPHVHILLIASIYFWQDVCIKFHVIFLSWPIKWNEKVFERRVTFLSLALFDSFHTSIVEIANNLHHTNSLKDLASHEKGWSYFMKRTEIIVITVSILLEEIFSDHFSNLQKWFLLLRKSVLTNKLHDFIKLILLLKDLFKLDSVLRKSCVFLVEIRFKKFFVFWIRNSPVNSREMLSLSKSFLKTPEHLHNS